MKTRSIVLTALLSVALGLFATRAFTDDPGAAMEEAWRALGTPGENHKWLGQFVGDWTADTTMWMAPGAEPTKSKGSYNARMVMDGRYLKDSYDGDFMGESFHGGGLIGFNNATGKFERCWIDTMSTGLMHAQGTRDGDVVEMRGEFNGPNGQVIHTREVTKLVGPDEFQLEAFNDAMGEETKVMEIVFKRRTGSDCR